MNAKKVLVTGATGQQGGAVARHLLKQPGLRVCLLVRDTTRPAAQELAQQGAELAQGDLDEPQSVKRALEGAWGAYSVQAMEAGYEGELRQGKSFADAAKSAGVQHFVYSSVVSADKNTGLPHFESKWQIEQYIMRLNFSYTILRPAFFMQNWYNFLREPILSGAIPLPCKPQTSLQQVSVEDIGRCAALAFQDPEDWRGRTLELAGDDLTMQHTAELFSKVLGRTVRYVQVPWDSFRQQAGDEITRMYRWFDDVGYHVSLASLRQELPFLQTLEQVLRSQDWQVGTARKAA